MKFNFRFTIIIVILFVMLISGVNLTQAHRFENDSPSISTLENPAHYPWKSVYVQHEPNPIRDVGAYVSMALRPFDDYPVITYYDFTNGDLMVAIPVSTHTGNCGTDAAWLCESVDGAGTNVGSYASIDVWGESINLWRLGISYHDITNNNLTVTIWTCTSGSCAKEYFTLTCSHYPDSQIGLNTSFKFNSLGYAAVAFFTGDPPNTGRLFYAHQVNTSSKNGHVDPSIAWECEQVFNWYPATTKSISLDFRYDDIPYISYHIKDLDTVWDPTGFAWYEPPPIDPNCDPYTTKWSCYNIDIINGVGEFASLKAPQYQGDVVRFAYIDEDSGHLKYFQSAWGNVIVDDIGTVSESRGLSMQIDNDGYPVIAYQKIESEFYPPALWIARPYMAYDDGEFGNCGEILPGMWVQYWRCTPLDIGNQYVSEAKFISMVINSKGRLAIAYSEFDEYHYFMSLKYIYQFLYNNYLPLTIKE